MLPAVALLAAKAAATGAAWLADQPLALVRGAPWILFGLIWAGVAWSHRAPFFFWEPDFVSDQLYSPNGFQVYPKVGDYLRRNMPPKATMATLGLSASTSFRRPTPSLVVLPLTP